MYKDKVSKDNSLGLTEVTYMYTYGNDGLMRYGMEYNILCLPVVQKYTGLRSDYVIVLFWNALTERIERTHHMKCGILYFTSSICSEAAFLNEGG